MHYFTSVALNTVTKMCTTLPIFHNALHYLSSNFVVLLFVSTGLTFIHSSLARLSVPQCFGNCCHIFCIRFHALVLPIAVVLSAWQLLSPGTNYLLTSSLSTVHIFHLQLKIYLLLPVHYN